VKQLIDEKEQLLKRVESEEVNDQLKHENKELKATVFNLTHMTSI
jgi:hypothetical protein